MKQQFKVFALVLLIFASGFSSGAVLVLTVQSKKPKPMDRPGASEPYRPRPAEADKQRPPLPRGFRLA